MASGFWNLVVVFWIWNGLLCQLPTWQQQWTKQNENSHMIQHRKRSTTCACWLCHGTLFLLMTIQQILQNVEQRCTRKGRWDNVPQLQIGPRLRSNGNWHLDNCKCVIIDQVCWHCLISNLFSKECNVDNEKKQNVTLSPMKFCCLFQTLEENWDELASIHLLNETQVKGKVHFCPLSDVCF